LGLEQEDHDDHSVGISSPFLGRYRKLISSLYLNPTESWKRLAADGVLEMRWRHAEDSDSVGWKVPSGRR